jgi:sec-independent protein translocase protein TatA
MGPFGFQEIVFIFIAALLIFGPKKLPEIGKTLGKGMREFKKATDDLKSNWEEHTRDSEIQELKQTVNEIKADVENTTHEVEAHVEETATEIQTEVAGATDLDENTEKTADLNTPLEETKPDARPN